MTLFTLSPSENPPSPPAPAVGRWTLSVLLGTLAGGLPAALAAFLAHRKDLALGLLAGCLLSSLNLYALKVLAERILEAGPRGRKTFWLWNMARWALAAVACWLLLSVSPTCLLGAGIGYVWSLIVLGWAGWKSAGSKKSP